MGRDATKQARPERVSFDIISCTHQLAHNPQADTPYHLPTMSRRAPRGEYIETDTGNKVARKATLVGTQNIMLGGKTVIMADAMIRGDLARTAISSSSAAAAPSSNTAIAIGRYCFLSKGCCLRPPGRMYKGYASVSFPLFFFFFFFCFFRSNTTETYLS